jgi:ribosomal protein S18 acetylase RimI-like enzyme
MESCLVDKPVRIAQTVLDETRMNHPQDFLSTTRAMTNSISIEPLEADDFAGFIIYLNDHLRDNGGPEAGYFQPLPRGGSAFPAERAGAFQTGMGTAVGSPAWRRAWVARSTDGRIAGHVDLRAHPDSFAEHRCVLGMGVDRRHRRAGIGAALIAHARQWAAGSGQLEWIDLQVISANLSAIGLYGRAGFIKAGEIPDMFRIDGKSFAYTTMSLRLGAL